MNALDLLDPPALALVIGGSLAVGGLHGTWRDVVDGWRALGPVFAPSRRFDADTARAEIARLERIARRDGVLALEREEIRDPALRRAVDAIVDNHGIETIDALLDEEADARARRRTGPQRYWSAVAEAAPAIGMIGTIIGMARMFAGMDDLARIGPAMGLALMATLYGAIMANLVAAPIAAKLCRLAEREEEARDRAETAIRRLAAEDLPVIAQNRRRMSA